MEISDYLRIARRRLLVLVGIPVLAVLLAVGYVLGSPRPYVASVFVSAPSLMGSQYGTYQGPGGASQFPSDFVATATSPAVLDAVARRTHVSVGSLENGVSVQQVDVSSRVEITYTTHQSSTAVPVVNAVARQTLTRLFAPQVLTAQAAVRSATASLHAANRALAEFTARQGSLLVGGQSTALSIEHADLLAQQTAAAGTLTTSRQVLAEAQAQLSAAAPRRVQAPAAVEVSLAHLVVTIVLPAAAVGLFLAIVLLALLELVAQRPGETTRDHLLAGTRRHSGNTPPATTPAGQPLTPQELEATE